MIVSVTICTGWQLIPWSTVSVATNLFSMWQLFLCTHYGCCHAVGMIKCSKLVVMAVSATTCTGWKLISLSNVSVATQYDFHAASISVETLRLLPWYRQDNVANSLYNRLNFVFCHADLWYLNIFDRITWQLIFNMRSVCELPHYRLFSRCFQHFLNCLVF